MKLLITGSRKLSRRTRVFMRSTLRVLDQYSTRIDDEDLVVIVGDCPTGSDLYVREICNEEGVHFIEYKAEWDVHGKAAGPIRNREMVDKEHVNSDWKIDLCLAFKEPYVENKGTEDCATYAESQGIRVVRYEGIKVVKP